MDIKQIDKNFDTSFTAPDDLEWFSVDAAPFSVHGIFFSAEEGLYRRLPREIADATNVGVSHLSRNTAGGRVRFATDSPYLALRVEEPFETPFPHLTIAGQCGVTAFTDRKYLFTAMPTYEQVAGADPRFGGAGRVTFDSIKYLRDAVDAPYQVELFLPLYNSVSRILVGLKRGCTLESPMEYAHRKPILFYGSSITQGGCAAKPGDDYISRLSRTLDFDFVNLGFSGSAKAEPVMVDYLAGQDPSVFLLDYDHNAPNAEHLAQTHYPLYETVRRAHPTTPIVMMTMPTVAGCETRPSQKARRDVIFETYERARRSGDENVYLVDCCGCFGAEQDGECGTVDGTHPDSLGFLRMAERLGPVLERILNGGA